MNWSKQRILEENGYVSEPAFNFKPSKKRNKMTNNKQGALCSLCGENHASQIPGYISPCLKTLTPCKRCDRGYPVKDMIQFQNEMYCKECGYEIISVIKTSLNDIENNEFKIRNQVEGMAIVASHFKSRKEIYKEILNFINDWKYGDK